MGEVTPHPRRLRLHPRLVDVSLAVVVGVGAVLIDGAGRDRPQPGVPLWHTLVWDVALALPLVARRRLPASAGAVLALLCLGQWTSGVIASGDAAVLLMLYTLGAWETRRWLIVAAAAVAEVGVVMAVTRWAPDAHAWLSGLMVTGTVTASLVLGVYVRTRRVYLATVLERAETAERERDTRAQLAVDAERTRMAREMHDIVAHSLSVMITLNDAAAAVADPERARAAVVQASEVGRQALGEMQRMLGVLRGDDTPELTPQPDAAGLTDLVGLVRSAGLAIDLAVTGDLADLPPTAQLTVFRIVQESLTNVLKHGTNVTTVAVGVAATDGVVTMSIGNDGDPVSPPSAGAPGHGLLGMRERAALFGGTCTARPGTRGGWRVEATLHIPAVALSR